MWFSEALATLREAKIRFLMSAQPHETTRVPVEGFHKILYLRAFRKSVGTYVNS
jgi:hypothetical protein